MFYAKKVIDAGYKKAYVAEAVAEHLLPIRSRYDELMKNVSKVLKYKVDLEVL